MAVIVPQTDVYLLKVPLEMDEMNQLTFSNKQAQFNYFNSLPKIPAYDFTYQRRDDTIRFGMCIDDILEYNYVMYRNEAYTDKWFYAFITDMEYLNDNVTAIGIKSDVWQCWQFELNFKPVFVEREHVNDDTIGANLVPESLETGEYIQNGSPERFGFYLNRYVINATYEPYTDNRYMGSNVAGIPMAGGLFVFNSWQQMNNAIQDYANRGRLEAIANVYAVPYTSFNDSDLDLREGSAGDPDFDYYAFTGSTAPKASTVTISRPNSIDGYTPKNNKLLTYPYQNAVITNNNGTVNNLYYEYFLNPASITIEAIASPTIGASIFVYPKNYKKIENNFNEGLMAGKYPTLSWSGDTYTNWLTQNAVNISAGIISDVAKLPIIPYNPVVGTANLVSSVANQISEVYKHSLVSQSVIGNTNGGDVLTGNKINNIYIYKMSITNQFARIIDQFFSEFGYKVNTVKVPNITGRRNWNYVKTIGCYIEADIPQDDLQEIKGMFDTGVTFWHNPATFADYSQNNDIL